MTLSDLFALFALVIAAVSLSWQFARSRLDQPIIVVTGEIRYMFDLDFEPDRWDLVVNVYNVGERPATVLECGWVFDREARAVSDAESEGPSRIEPHDHLEVVISKSLSYDWPRSFAEPFATVVRRPHRWWTRTPAEAIRTVYGKPVSAIATEVGEYDE